MKQPFLNRRYKTGTRAVTPLSMQRIKTVCGDQAHNLEALNSVVGVTTADAPLAGHVVFFDELDDTLLKMASSPVFRQMLLIVPQAYAGNLPGPHIATTMPREIYAALTTELFDYMGQYWEQNEAVHPTAQIDKTVRLSVGVVIGAGSVVGANCLVLPNVVIGPRCRIGENCLIMPGAVIGKPGFGIIENTKGDLVHFPQVGGVVIEDSVEVGSFSTICSGTIHPTVVGCNTKMDDHVHIAHNVIVGRRTILTACAEVSGSVQIGERCWIGPNASIRDGLTIGDGAMIGIAANVVREVPAGSTVAGIPARGISRISKKR